MGCCSPMPCYALSGRYRLTGDYGRAPSNAPQANSARQCQRINPEPACAPLYALKPPTLCHDLPGHQRPSQPLSGREPHLGRIDHEPSSRVLMPYRAVDFLNFAPYRTTDFLNFCHIGLSIFKISAYRRVDFLNFCEIYIQSNTNENKKCCEES